MSALASRMNWLVVEAVCMGTPENSCRHTKIAAAPSAHDHDNREDEDNEDN